MDWGVRRRWGVSYGMGKPIMEWGADSGMGAKSGARVIYFWRFLTSYPME